MGLYKKMPMADVEASFNRLVGDPSMRSLAAVLRIGQEQLDARGRLGKWRNIAIIAGAFSVLALFSAPFLPNKWKALTQEVQIGAAVICGVCVLALWRVRGELDKNLEEEVRLRKLILAAAQKITTAPSFSPGPLHSDLKATLKESIRKEGHDEDLEAILDFH